MLLKGKDSSDETENQINSGTIVHFLFQMRIPTEHFRNVPVVLLSPSLMTTPVTSTAPSPSHHAHLPPNGSANVFDDAFPRTLLERLMRTETQSKV